MILNRFANRLTAPSAAPAQSPARAETDVRLQLLNSLLVTPHRKLGDVYTVHRDIAVADPRFYVQLAAWYVTHGSVRDHAEAFAVVLALSDDPTHRDVGLALVRKLPPYQVGRVVDFISGRKISRRTKSGVRVERVGLFGNVPRSLKTEVERYLREREADVDRFDSAALVARKAMKRLYALLHIKPSPRAQAILFDGNPPPDSRLAALKALRFAKNPADQARAIVEHAIPYRIASTVVSQMTPSVLLALVSAMSPQELINNLGSLRKRGAFDVQDVKTLIDEKLAEAATGDRVSAFKTAVAADASGVDGETRQKLEAVADAQIKAKGRITRSTALLIDKSASMTDAIEVGRRIGALVSAITDAPLVAYAFDSAAYPIAVPKGEASLADWERALSGINAGGATSLGAPVDIMRRRKQVVEQFVVVTDEGENTGPHLAPTLVRYAQELSVQPEVLIVRIGWTHGGVTKQLEQAGFAVDAYEFKGDYYSLPNLVPLLSRPGRLELLMEILETPLPQRRAA
jgi:hypothetical protein